MVFVTWKTSRWNIYYRSFCVYWMPLRSIPLMAWCNLLLT